MQACNTHPKFQILLALHDHGTENVEAQFKQESGFGAWHSFYDKNCKITKHTNSWMDSVCGIYSEMSKIVGKYMKHRCA